MNILTTDELDNLMQEERKRLLEMPKVLQKDLDYLFKLSAMKYKAEREKKENER